MNSSQKQSVANAIQDFFSEEKQLEQIASEKYKSEQSIDTIIVQDYSLTEIIFYSREVVKKISDRLELENWQILPFLVTSPEVAQFYLHSGIIELKRGLQSGNYIRASNFLKGLIYYATINGFWQSVPKIELGIRDASLAKLQQRAELTMEHIDERAKIANSTIKQLEEKIKEINDLIIKKQQEFKVLQNNQNQSNNLLNNITNVNKNAEGYNSTIEQIKNKCTTILTDLEKKQEDALERQNIIIKQIVKAESNLQDFELKSKKKIDLIQGSYASVSSNVEEVRKMMGYVADGTLSHSFNKRKENIKHSEKRWLWISLATLLLLVGWTLCVFIWLRANTGIIWADILINGIKVTPLAFAFGFALTEYSKERNLLEEYAFREAVAVTLTAYLEQLKGNTTEEQQQLLTNTVEKLYTKPIFSAKEYKLINLDTKDLAKIIEQLKDLKK